MIDTHTQREVRISDEVIVTPRHVICISAAPPMPRDYEEQITAEAKQKDKPTPMMLICWTIYSVLVMIGFIALVFRP